MSRHRLLLAYGSAAEARPTPNEQADCFAAIATEMRDVVDVVLASRDADPAAALTKLVEATVRLVPAATAASVSVLGHTGPRTLAQAGEGVTNLDVAQYEAGEGPCLDAMRARSIYVTDDVGCDERWPLVGPRLSEAGARAVASYRLTLHDTDLTASLNLYSDRVGAFAPAALWPGLILAGHCELLLTAKLAVDRAADLADTLESNRELGLAVGILMARHALTPAQGLALLRSRSDQENLNVRAVAREVIESGDIGLQSWPGEVPGPTSPPASAHRTAGEGHNVERPDA